MILSHLISQLTAIVSFSFPFVFGEDSSSIFKASCDYLKARF